jgi:hypothetical protein
MTDDEVVADFERKVQDLIVFVRSSERLRALLPIVKLVVEELTELGNVDPELEPEILAAMTQMEEASETIVRAFKFASARMNARMEAS